MYKANILGEMADKFKIGSRRLVHLLVKSFLLFPGGGSPETLIVEDAPMNLFEP